MSTFIDGIGQCEVLDKSAELVDLKGHDITSLAKTGTFTWEHQANSPATLVGKILQAKKIFNKDDCENERHVYFWNKCKKPYLYVMGELLDEYTASAKECAGQMKYSKDHPDKAPLLGFSIEGSEIPNTRKGMVITRSIARKVTLTQSPCNSMCVAEIYEAPEQKSQIADDFDSIFKSQEEAITLFKSGEGVKIYEDYLAKKEAEGPSKGGKTPKNPYNEYENQGIRIGTTKSGKHVFSHGHIGAYSFNPAEHKEAAEHHRRAAVTAENPKLVDNHIQRMQMHNNAAISGGRQENRAALSLNQKRKVSQEQGKQQVAKSEKSCDLHKAMSASWSPGKVSGSTVHYSHPEHGTVSIQKQPSGEFHVKHNGAMAGVGGIKGSFASPKEAGAHAQKYMSAVSQKKIFAPKPQNHASPSMVGKSELKKAITAGSYNAAPSTLVNGSAYQTESLGSKQATTGAEEHKFQGSKKKDWAKRAKDDYDRWPHKEKFEKFMSARLPHLAMGEIRALGRALALKKNLDFEKSLNKLVKSEEAKKELEEKSLEKIQIETAKKWADRAEESYKKAIEEKSIKQLLDSEEFFHEAIEHSSLSEDLSVFEEIKAKLMPIREKALKLLAPGAKA